MQNLTSKVSSSGTLSDQKKKALKKTLDNDTHESSDYLIRETFRVHLERDLNITINKNLINFCNDNDFSFADIISDTLTTQNIDLNALTTKITNTDIKETATRLGYDSLSINNKDFSRWNKDIATAMDKITSFDFINKFEGTKEHHTALFTTIEKDFFAVNPFL